MRYVDNQAKFVHSRFSLLVEKVYFNSLIMEGTMLTHASPIEHLSQREIFVFGSNLRGFHGAGAAGFASFGVHGNRWREFGYAQRPDGWAGRWNVKGRGEGLQRGTHGWSYALPTVTSPGARRSIPASTITQSIRTLYTVARRNPSWVFVVAQGTSGGLNGYHAVELAAMFTSAGDIPCNVSFDRDFAKLL